MADEKPNNKIGHLSPKIVIPIFVVIILVLAVAMFYAYDSDKFMAMADDATRYAQQKSEKYMPKVAAKIGVSPKESYTFGSRPINDSPAPLNEKVALPEIAKGVVQIYPTQTDKSRNNPGTPPVYVGKCIEIDLSVQRMFIWENGILLNDWAVSSGKPEKPTKQGNFKVLDKMRWAYGSGEGDVWAMPYWMGFYFSGGTENGMHGLPLINGRKEGHGSLGIPVSHGCVRSSDANQIWLYEWAEIGMPVIVHK